MPLQPGFTDYALELLSGVGGVSARRMFGGAGIFKGGVMFALLDDDVIYVRVDESLRADLEAQGSIAWVYSMRREGGSQIARYWSMPETAADDPEEATAIARRAYDATVKLKASRTDKPAKAAKRVKAAKKSKKSRR